MIVEKQMECRLAGGETEVLGENLPQRHFCPPQIPHDEGFLFLKIRAVGLWVLRPLLIYCTSPG
jgi:hypothetical protein